MPATRCPAGAERAARQRRHGPGTLPPEGEVAARYEAVAVSGRAPDYLFGQSAGETERLRLQARMFAPYTAWFLEDAGISPGMKVLDVGTGAGDVALLVAVLVGQEGTVVGIDFNAELIGTARARAAAAGIENVSFVVGDAASAELDRDLDAVAGRCVLFFAREPAALLRRLNGLRPRRRHRRVPGARQCDAGADVPAELTATGQLRRAHEACPSWRRPWQPCHWVRPASTSDDAPAKAPSSRPVEKYPPNVRQRRLRR